jgi:hypothetical protein
MTNFMVIENIIKAMKQMTGFSGLDSGIELKHFETKNIRKKTSYFETGDGGKGNIVYSKQLHGYFTKKAAKIVPKTFLPEKCLLVLVTVLFPKSRAGIPSDLHLKIKNYQRENQKLNGLYS